jgi:outer membrane protein TolC
MTRRDSFMKRWLGAPAPPCGGGARACAWKGRWATGLAVALIGTRAAFALPPLEQLEARAALSPAAQLADRAYTAESASLKADRVGLGVSAFGDIGAAHNHDIIDPVHSYAYNQTMGGAGLLLPLLGSRLQIESGLVDQRARLAQLEARRQLEQREIVGRLRKAYASYWQAQRLNILAESYVTDEPRIERALAQRTRAGLTLDSDRLELLTSFALARRDEAQSSLARASALALMTDLTGLQLDGGVAVRPLVPAACIARNSADTDWENTDPELVALRKVIAVRETDPRDSPLYPVQSNIQLSFQTQDQLTTGRHGGSAALTWWFQVPIEYGSQRRLLSEATAARLSGARLEYQLRRQELEEQRASLIARLEVLRQAREFAAARLAAADAAVGERTLRAQTLDGDVLERLQQAQAARYTAATDLVRTETDLVEWYGDWARFDTRLCDAAEPTTPGPPEDDSAARSNDLGDPRQPERARRPDRALYVWKSGQWLTESDDAGIDAKFAALRAVGVTRILVSLDAGQMARALADPAMLTAAVSRTHQHGFSIALLLGDPHWILPEHRAALIRIITALGSVPFDALHLDLEPEQLGEPAGRTPALLGSLADTLAAVTLASPWPIGVSIHPRDLDVSVDGTPFGVLLGRLRVSPTLMIYVSNPDRAIAIAAPLLRRYSDLTFRVAVSLEGSLPRAESLRPFPYTERRRRIGRIESQLAAPNFAGLSFELEDGWSEAALLPAPDAGSSEAHERVALFPGKRT